MCYILDINFDFTCSNIKRAREMMMHACKVRQAGAKAIPAKNQQRTVNRGAKI